MTNPNTAPIPRACGPDDHDCILATPTACKQRGCQSACRDAGGAAPSADSDGGANKQDRQLVNQGRDEGMRAAFLAMQEAQTGGGEAVAPEAKADRAVFEQWYDAQPDGKLSPWDVWQSAIQHAIKSGHACTFALDNGGNLYRRYKEPQCAPPAPPAPLPGKESAFLSAVATIYIDPHDERQELEYIGHIPRGELIRLYKAPNAVHADLLNVAIAVRDACHKAWVTSAENWRADVDVKSIVSAALSSPPAQAAPADYPPPSDAVSRDQAIEHLDYLHEAYGIRADWEPLADIRRFIEQSGRSGVSADPLPCPQPSAQGPAELWLQLHGDCHESEFTQPVDYTSDDITWCWHKIHDSDVRYVRADTDMQAEIDRMSDALREIGDFAHDRSTGPAVPDALWEVRSMAYSAESNITSPQHQVKKGESS